MEEQELRAALEAQLMELEPDEWGRISKGLALAIVRGELDYTRVAVET